MSVGVPYGAGEDTVGRNIRIKKFQFPDGSIGLEPMEMAKRRARVLMDNYFGKAARLKQWLNNQKLRAVEDARTFSILGRCRWYTIPDEDDPERNQKLAKIGRDAGNQPIQSCVVGSTRVFDRTRGYVRIDSLVGHEVEVWTEPDSRKLGLPMRVRSGS